VAAVERADSAGDLGVGDIVPTDPDDDRLVPGYAAYEPEVEEFADEPNAFELGIAGSG